MVPDNLGSIVLHRQFLSHRYEGRQEVIGKTRFTTLRMECQIPAKGRSIFRGAITCARHTGVVRGCESAQVLISRFCCCIPPARVS